MLETKMFSEHGREYMKTHDTPNIMARLLLLLYHLLAAKQGPVQLTNGILSVNKQRLSELSKNWNSVLGELL